MKPQYSFSADRADPTRWRQARCLAIDSGSPVISAAVAVAGEQRAVRSTTGRNASGAILKLVDEVLDEAALRPGDLDLLLGVRGPGSFTGLRVAMATLYGLSMVLETPVGTWSTFEVLASLARSDGGTIAACVDALRGNWLVQTFAAADTPRPAGPPILQSTGALERARVQHFIGFGVSRLQVDPESSIEPGPLAPLALKLLDRHAPDFDPAHMANPLYLQPPAARRPPTPGV